MSNTDIVCFNVYIQVVTAEMFYNFVTVFFALVGSLVWDTFYFKGLVSITLLVITNLYL